MEKNKHELRELVRSGYADIAVGKKTCCCSTKRHGQANPEQLAMAIGYDQQTLDALPEGANLGVSCGNPVALAALLPGQTVVDLGSGGGFDIFQAGLKVGKEGKAIGVDMTAEMLNLARRNIATYKERSGLDNVSFRLGEIEYLPLPDSFADVVMSNCVINLSPDKPQVWREIKRVLKPGGKAAVSDLALLRPLPENIKTMASALIGCVGGAVLIEETKALLQSTGFNNISLTPNPAYVKAMVEWNDPLYAELTAAIPPGEHLADYVTSLSITAYK